jgi:hypothetical protein
MDFEELLQNIKDNLMTLVKKELTGYATEGGKEVTSFLKTSYEKLKRWTQLLEAREISRDEYEWLVASQKDLLALEGLYQAGVSKIVLNRFKNAVIQTIVNTVFKWIV